MTKKNCDRWKLDRRRLKAKREVALVMVTGNVFQEVALVMVTGNVFQEVALVMVTGNVFQTLIDLKKKLLAILLLRKKGFHGEGPV